MKKNIYGFLFEEPIDKAAARLMDIYEHQNNYTRDLNLFSHMRKLRSFENKKVLLSEDMSELIHMIGTNPYLDRWLVDFIISHRRMIDSRVLSNIIMTRMAEPDMRGQDAFHLMDIAIECRLEILDHHHMEVLIDHNRSDWTLYSMVLDYIQTFSLSGFKTFVYDLISDDTCPTNLRLAAVKVILDFEGEMPMMTFRESEDSPMDTLIQEFENLMSTCPTAFGHGLVLMQTMFHGDFQDNGKGSSGGMAVLLRTLGDALGKKEEVGMVLSVSVNHVWNSGKTMVNDIGEGHRMVRLPFYLDTAASDPYLMYKNSLRRYMAWFLDRMNLIPDIMHVRYLDPASEAVGELCDRMGKRLVFTLTSDPHRTLFTEDGRLNVSSRDDLLSKLNRMRIGDLLMEKADGIMGIGLDKAKENLLLFFPKLRKDRFMQKVIMVEEAIEVKDNKVELLSNEEVATRLAKLGIPTGLLDTPLILNVGRLNEIKGQDRLLEAWGNSKWSKTHHLLMIGGDLEQPNQQEEAMLNRMTAFMNRHPELGDSFHHIGALANDDIRWIEQTIMKAQKDQPNIYMCSSLKEEFGIAILEAMSEGFLTIAPEKGGVSTYMKNGINGFMVDTATWQSLSMNLDSIFDRLMKEELSWNSIEKAGVDTVMNRYTMETISFQMLDMYLGLYGKDRIRVA